MIRAMDNVTLPQELERFVAEAVAAGRYTDVSDAVIASSAYCDVGRAGADLLASLWPPRPNRSVTVI